MRDCDNCTHKTENGCEKWECDFVPTGGSVDISLTAESRTKLWELIEDLNVSETESFEIIDKYGNRAVYTRTILEANEE